MRRIGIQKAQKTFIDTNSTQTAKKAKCFKT